MQSIIQVLSEIVYKQNREFGMCFKDFAPVWAEHVPYTQAYLCGNRGRLLQGAGAPSGRFP
jgi:hypothetical protein